MKMKTNNRFELIFWKGDAVNGDWDAVTFESREAAERSGWVIDSVANGNHMGHYKGRRPVYEQPAEPEKKEIAVSVHIELKKQFYTVRDAWELKGGCAWNTFRGRRFLQPKGGHFDGYYAGKGIFTAETIREWLPLTDKELLAYHHKYLTGAQPTNRIRIAHPKEALYDLSMG